MRVSRYSLKQIVAQLRATAQGNAYHGNALRVAKDLDGVTPEDRTLLDACMKKGITFDMRMRLQDLAIRISPVRSKQVGIVVQGPVAVVRYGSGCVGCMAWETPYVVLAVPCHGEVRYQSDRVDGPGQRIQGRPAPVGAQIPVRLVLNRDGTRVRRFAWREGMT